VRNGGRIHRLSMGFKRRDRRAWVWRIQITDQPFTDIREFRFIGDTCTQSCSPIPGDAIALSAAKIGLSHEKYNERHANYDSASDDPGNRTTRKATTVGIGGRTCRG